MFFALRTSQQREFLMNERIQALEIPGALLTVAAGCCITATARSGWMCWHPGAVCLRRAVERSFVPRRRLSSSPGLSSREPRAPGTGSDLRVTVLAVLEPRQIPRLPELGLRT
jgi:hypothetical protein